jgi:rRNA biogenesis protein RRP5
MDSIVGVTLRQTMLESATVSVDDLQIGSIIRGTVKKINENGVSVQIGFGLRGFVPNIHLAEVPQIANREQLFPFGKTVKCRITKIDKSSTHNKVNLTCKKSLLSKKFNILSSYENAKPGFQTDGVVALIHKKGLLIEFFNGVKGFIPLRYLSTYRIENPEKVFKIGQIIRCTVVSTDIENERMTCSLINIKDMKKKQNKNEQFLRIDEEFDSDPKKLKSLLQNMKIGTIFENALLIGRDESGNTVFKLPNGIKAIATKNHLYDKNDFEEFDFKTKFSIGSTHRCRVRSINLKDSTVDITLRKSLLEMPTVSIDELQVGSIINGNVKTISKNGVFVQIGFGLEGLIPNIHLEESPQSSDREQLFPIGKKVKCRITKIDKSSQNKVSLTCKKSLLSKKLNILSSYKNAKPGFQTDGVVALIHKKGLLIEFFNGVKGFIPKKYLSEDRIEYPEKIFKIGEIIRCTVISTGIKNERMTCSLIEIKNAKKNKNQNKEFLRVSEAFNWNIDEATPNLNSLDSMTCQNSSTDSDSDESDSEDKNLKRRKTRKERNEEVRNREELLRRKEELLMDTERKPETVDDFEISVLASPNSSLVWLKYMAFHLEQAEITKARAVGERALKTISFREEQEKLNVWVALLNLENLYGTQSSLEELFQRALQFNDPLVIYNHLANIYSQSNKSELTEALYHTMLKKFKQNKTVWINFGLYYMKNNRLESARKLMQRSLTCLEKRDHIEVISKFAQMEFKFGDPEHGKTLFENILSNFPKRVDLWSVYIDMMCKYVLKNDNKESEDSVRNIFERVITLKLAAKKMKFIFKRYIEFESQYNNEDRIDRIKQKALEYVEGNALN